MNNYSFYKIVVMLIQYSLRIGFFEEIFEK